MSVKPYFRPKNIYDVKLDKLIPTLLVYRAYPRISNLDPPTLSIIEQTTAVQKAIAEIVKLWAK